MILAIGVSLLARRRGGSACAPASGSRHRGRARSNSNSTPTRAPATVANFLRYVDEQFFDGTSFYRTVTAGNQPDNLIKIEVIQGGADGGKGAHEPIGLEPTSVTGLKHVDGAVSMARNAPDTATSEFFICVGDQPELDFGGRRNPDGQGFAAFGRVVKGSEVVKLIHQRAADRQRLAPPVTIRSIRRVSAGVR